MYIWLAFSFDCVVKKVSGPGRLRALRRSKKVIKQVLMYQALFSVLILGGTYAFAPHNVLSAALGCGLIAVNLPAVIWSWSRIFQKKSIALAVSVIVFKYAILGVIIYLVTSRPELDGMSFLIGLTSIVPTMLIFTLQNANKNL